MELITSSYADIVALLKLAVSIIGPLTNVALAMKADPGLPTRLKQISIMGGNIGKNIHQINLQSPNYVYVLDNNLHIMYYVFRSLKKIFSPEHSRKIVKSTAKVGLKGQFTHQTYGLNR